MANLMLDGLPVLDLLEVTADSTVVANLLNRHQSAVSRIYRQLSHDLELNFIKQSNGFYSASQNHRVLACLREAAQLLRLKNLDRLRWVSGSWNYLLLNSLDVCPPPLSRGWFGEARTLELLKTRVLDLAVVSSIDSLRPGTFMDDNSDPHFFNGIAAFGLGTYPLEVSAHSSHPLIGAQQLSPEDFSTYPSLAALKGMFYERSLLLRSHGLWRTPRRLRSYSWQRWEGESNDGVTLVYTNPISRKILSSSLEIRPLNYALDVMDRDVLLVREDLIDVDSIQSLLAIMRKQYRMKTLELLPSFGSL